MSTSIPPLSGTHYHQAQAIDQSPRPDVVHVLAQAWGCATLTARQARKVSDPRSPAMKVARAITALRHYGYQHEADALARPVLVAWALPWILLLLVVLAGRGLACYHNRQERRQAIRDVLGAEPPVHRGSW